MPTHFLFVDETGNPSSGTTTSYYGFGVVEVISSQYWKIRQILAEERWRQRFYKEFELNAKSYPVLNVFKQLQELSENDLVAASGLFVRKDHYGGRYLKWSDVEQLTEDQWPHAFRNYILRHALEFHYADRLHDQRRIDLVIDRIGVNREQRKNLEAYLRSKMPLQRPFDLPEIEHVTISDSEYTGGLQIADMIASVVKRAATDTLEAEVTEIARFIRIASFVGGQAPAT